MDSTMNRPTITQFIANFKQSTPNEKQLTQSFTQGLCYHFSVILKNLYPEGHIVYDSINGHFVFSYFDKFYDITGEVEYESHNGLEYLSVIELNDPSWYNRLMRDCVYKQ